MPLQKFTSKVSPDYAGKRLDEYLCAWLGKVLKKEVSRGKARKLAMDGGVFLNGKRVKIVSKQLFLGAEVQAWVDEKKFFSDPASQEKPFHFTKHHIVFEDDSIVVVNKPTHLPTQPTLDSSRSNLFEALKKYYPPTQYIGLHHRLDRDTSGLVLFTKAKEANRAISDAFQNHTIQKTYYAVTYGEKPPIQKKLTVKNFLGKVQALGKRAKFGQVKSGGDAAETVFELIESRENQIYLWKCQPKTGRTHQIRVHLSEMSFPILGDDLYFSKESQAVKAPRLFLHASELKFSHPLTKNEITCKAPLPPEFGT